MNGRKKELERILATQMRIKSVISNKGWQLVKEYIKEQIKEAKSAFWKTTIDDLSDKRIIRHTIAQRATVKALKGVLHFVYDKETKSQAESDLEKIEIMQEELGEEE